MRPRNACTPSHGLQALMPFANALTPLVENILLTDLRRFATYAQANKVDA